MNSGVSKQCYNLKPFRSIYASSKLITEVPKVFKIIYKSISLFPLWDLDSLVKVRLIFIGDIIISSIYIGLVYAGS